ncbi:sodium:proton antiporter [Aggregicoccus sp. 17bor-14]|uniref:cation:proton antiporter n=1 Tax=Myxococcaceae TaxID=31 RepID=UPI00129CEE2D|nr:MULTISPECIES: sodium:proton antiporter [Myxococcaceae]MBF5045625.1 sodium:proton antiporter [Simulacricoccus sp. 17bor-14]MRI91362.1 sodium:proton antiporter [Aggregicoccus sp. 17bor-14]
MLVFEIIIALLLGGAGLTALSRRLGTPYPAMVALAGAALALVPGTPTLVLDPELALTLFVAPVLLDAAFDSSPRDMAANWRTIAGLAIGAVALTIFVVAGVARLLVPDMSWAVAIALGAIVAPPDAAAATAVLKQLRPPHRLLVILEGESLFNDASALLVYRLAVGAAVAGSLSPMSAIPLLLVVTVGSVVLGLVLSRVIIQLIARIEDVAIAVVVQFCGTFGVWMLAEQLHLSGILTVVVFAMASARRSAELTPARLRIPSYAVWEFAVFVLNVLAFILVGFQLKGILERIDRPTLFRYAGIAAAVCLATILARIAWVMLAAGVSRWRCQGEAGAKGGRRDTVGLSRGAAAVVGWCGMRGIVTLAAALALPAGDGNAHAFPFRDLILFTAFSVVLGTLVVQGMTLRPLIRALKLRDDGSVEREVRLARVETLRAALTAASAPSEDEMAELLRRRYQARLRRAEADLAADGKPAARQSAPDGTSFAAATALARKAAGAERQRLIALRADGTIGDAAFQRIEQELDLEELDLQQLEPDTGSTERA